MIKTKVIKQAEKVEKELNHATLKCDSDLINKGITVIDTLLDNHNLSIMDIEQDGLNCIIDYDTALDETQSKVKDNINNAPAVNDLAYLYNHDFFNYVYINGYARIEPVNNDDVSMEINDIITFIKDNHLN